MLDELCREMVDQGFHVPSANYFGLMNPTPTYMGVLAEALVAGLNPQLATLARSQLASKIELETVRWIGERVGWPGEFNGTFTSGGNEANFSGIALALASKFPRFGGRRRGRDRRPANASMPQPSRTTRSTSLRACWESGARHCGASQSMRLLSSIRRSWIKRSTKIGQPDENRSAWWRLQEPRTRAPWTTWPRFQKSASATGSGSTWTALTELQ